MSRSSWVFAKKANLWHSDVGAAAHASAREPTSDDLKHSPSNGNLLCMLIFNNCSARLLLKIINANDLLSNQVSRYHLLMKNIEIIKPKQKHSQSKFPSLKATCERSKKKCQIGKFLSKWWHWKWHRVRNLAQLTSWTQWMSQERGIRSSHKWCSSLTEDG